jgi:membrane protease YdiL (CAAX protease family)
MRALLTFFAATYFLSWICFITAGILLRDASVATGFARLSGPLFLLGALMPSLVALAQTAQVDGSSGVQALLRRILRWRVRARWYVFAIAYMAVIKLAVALAHRIITGAWPRFGQESWLIMAASIAVSTWVQAGEEIGWRGYALPRLAALFGLARASLLLGVIWACWHLPLFFVAGVDKSGQSFPLYLLQVTALSVAAAWLYWRTDGSLLLVMLMHAAVNNTKDIVPSALPGATNPWSFSASLVGWMTVVLLWVPAAYFLRRMGDNRAPTLEVSAGDAPQTHRLDADTAV